MFPRPIMLMLFMECLPSGAGWDANANPVVVNGRVDDASIQ